jgi:hypothetical protein
MRHAPTAKAAKIEDILGKYDLNQPTTRGFIETILASHLTWEEITELRGIMALEGVFLPKEDRNEENR